MTTKSIFTTTVARASRLGHQMRRFVEDEPTATFESHCHWCNWLIIIDVGLTDTPKVRGWALKRKCPATKTRGEKR